MKRLAGIAAVVVLVTAAWVGLNLVGDSAGTVISGVPEPGFLASAAGGGAPEVGELHQALAGCAADRDSLGSEVRRLEGVAQTLRAQRDAALAR